MFSDLLKDTIRDNHGQSPDEMFSAVDTWLKSRGINLDEDWYQPTIIERENLELFKIADRKLNQIYNIV